MQRIWPFYSRRRRYRDLSASIHEHIADRIEELVEGGMPPAQAEHSARREFGNVSLIEQRSREVWQWPAMESIWADVRFAVRQLIKSPGFTLTAVVTLTLGIGVNATMFSLVSAFLMPHVPGRDPGHVAVVSSVNPDRSFLPDINPVSVPNYLSWRTHSRIFAEMAAADEYRTASISGEEQPEAIQYAAVSPNYFAVLGVSPVLGRNFLAADDQPGHDRLAILSHELWERRFASDPSVVGRTIRLDREGYIVVGVMGADFKLLGFTPQLWTPLALSPADRAPEARKDRSLYLFARLAPGITLQKARAQMNILARQAGQDFPATEKRWGVAVRTLPDFLVYEFNIRNALAVIMTTVSFVLLIACANVAGLLLSRASGRRKELAIRASLGASRARVVRQLLTEGLVIALSGGAAGLLISYYGIQVLRAALTFNDEISAVPVRLDGKVLVFALCASLASALLASLVPALKASRTQINTDLRSEGRAATAGRGQSRLRASMVGGEIALALFLLVGAGLLIHGVLRLEHQDLGFRIDHLLTAGIDLDHARYGDPSRQILFVRDLLLRLRQIPGVEDAAITSDLPASGPGSVSVRIKGEPELPSNQQHKALSVVVTPNYFNVAGIPLLRGRNFTSSDDASAPQVVLVNQQFVHRFFNDRDPLGKQIQLDIKDAAPSWAVIVGVVSDVKRYSEGTDIDPEVFEPFLQRPVTSFSLMLRSNVEPNSLAPALRHAVAQSDSDLPLLRVMSMERVIEAQRNGDPVFLRMMGTFAMLALILASIGIYGLVAYSVSQRTHEFGIRLALGAKGTDISGMILRESFKIAAIGSAIGLLAALPLPRLFDAMFGGIHFGAIAVYPAVVAAMLIVALFAACGPARRAMHVDPAAALRNE
jgi:predicted permease